MAYNRNPPAPVRFVEGQPVVPPIPVALQWPSIAALVSQDTAPVECHLPDPEETRP